MGMSSMVAGSGLLLAPHIVRLVSSDVSNNWKTVQGDYWRILPMIVMGLMALSAGILTFFLPETLGAPLPMTIDDAENFGLPAADLDDYPNFREEGTQRTIHSCTGEEAREPAAAGHSPQEPDLDLPPRSIDTPLQVKMERLVLYDHTLFSVPV